MKKLFLGIVFFCLLSLIFVPFLIRAQEGLVPCDGADCTIEKFIEMLANIYNFIVLKIATPLAVIMITIGGIVMMASAGNPGLMGKGKTIFWSAIIGLVLAIASYAIINTILSTLGFTGSSL